jgi:N-acetylmuramoyl-L-alanine amidase
VKYFKYTFIVLFALSVVGTPWVLTAFPQGARTIDSIFSYVGNNFTAAFLRTPVITIAQLQKKYDVAPRSKAKIRILIMPGHEPDYGGAEYGDLKERDMTVDLARYLEEFIKNNPRYEVVLARDKDNWHPVLANYFNTYWSDIIAFFNERKSESLHLINKGTIKKLENSMIHNNARQDVALRLYGINKWANENKIDIAIHLHFNDYPRKNSTQPGKYSGFAIYIPEKQFANSTTTSAIANSIFKRLSKYSAVSDLPKEGDGIVEEQDLIAIGSHNTLDVPSMLIEYGYIYEPQFADPSIRDSTLKDLAFQTYLGLQDFFGSGNDFSLAYDTLVLPYNWTEDMTAENSNMSDVFALQSALMLEGVYPPQPKTKNDCPRSGKFGPCTVNALAAFQKKYGIDGNGERVGTETRQVLNERYSVQIK